MPDAAMLHNVSMQNNKTYRNVLLSHDFLAKFDRIKFDFVRVQIGKHWFPCEDVVGKETVKVKKRISLAARSEAIASVKCNTSLSLVTADFEPISLNSIPGFYATNRRIIHDLEGIFQIMIFNVNDSPLDLYARICIGKIVSLRIFSLQQEPSKLTDQMKCAQNLNHGEHLTKNQ